MWGTACGGALFALLVLNVATLLAVTQRLARPATPPRRWVQPLLPAAAVPMIRVGAKRGDAGFVYVADVDVEACVALVRREVLHNDSLIQSMVAADRREATLWLAGQALARPALARGDFIETGVAGGGMSVVLRAMQLCVAKARGGGGGGGAAPQRLWMADSWQGLPDGNGAFELVDGLVDPDANLHPGNYNVGWETFTRNAERAAAHFDRLGWGALAAPASSSGARRSYFDLERSALRGWFNDTLPRLMRGGGRTFSFLRLDGDMFISTYQALEHLYPALQCGGFVYVDDYHAFKQCRKAVEHYMATHGGLSIAPWSIFTDSEYKWVDNALALKSDRAVFIRATPRQVWRLGAATEGVWWQKEC